MAKRVMRTLLVFAIGGGVWRTAKQMSIGFSQKERVVGRLTILAFNGNQLPMPEGMLIGQGPHFIVDSISGAISIGNRNSVVIAAKAIGNGPIVFDTICLYALAIILKKIDSNVGKRVERKAVLVL